MMQGKVLQLMFLSIAVLAVVGAAMLQQPFDRLREDIDRTTGEDMNREFAELKLIQAIPGGLRALMIDYLWIQSETMKQQGKFYDVDQKTELICKLQPRFPAVWYNRAWNLAYNVSHKTHTPAERWEYVSRGIRLLRDQGIKYNPKSLVLYKELAWIYHHKIGEMLDDMHLAYKSFHAAEYHRILGAPPKPGEVMLNARLAKKADSAAEADTAAKADTDASPEKADALAEAHIKWLGAIEAAPDSAKELLEDPAVADFVAQLQALDIELGIDFIDAYNAWSGDPHVRMLDQPIAVAENETEGKIQALLTDPDQVDTRNKVMAFCRKQTLTETYKLKPSWMIRTVKKYGPVDWRLCWPHCLYWSSYGVYNIKGHTKSDIDSINSARQIINPLKSLVSYGFATLIYNHVNPDQPYVQMETNWRFIDAAEEAHQDIKEYYTGEEGEGTLSHFQAGHENFLKTSIQTLFCAGQLDKANAYYRKAKSLYRIANPMLYSLDLEQFVYQSLNPQGVPRRQDMAQFVAAQVQRAYRYLAMGYDENFDLYMTQAKWFWKRWNDEINDDPRKVLEPFEMIQAQAAVAVLQRLPIEAQITLWTYIPLVARQAAYDPMVQLVKPICDQMDIDFDKAFPEPPNMEMVRKQRAEMVQQREGAPFHRSK